MKDESFSTEIGLDLALTELVLLISLIFPVSMPFFYLSPYNKPIVIEQFHFMQHCNCLFYILKFSEHFLKHVKWSFTLFYLFCMCVKNVCPPPVCRKCLSPSPNLCVKNVCPPGDKQNVTDSLTDWRSALYILAFNQR